MEKYLQNYPLTNLKNLSLAIKKPLVFVDLETTGLLHEQDFTIIEIGVVRINGNTVIEESALINPQMIIPPHITGITGITNEMVKGKQTFKNFVPYFEKISRDSILCGFNSRPFDSKGIERVSKKYGSHFVFNNQIDIRQVFIKTRNNMLGVKSQAGKLTEAGEFHNIKLKGTAHRAAYDIALTTLLAEQIIKDNNFECLSHEFMKCSCERTKKLYNDFLKFSLQH